MNITVQILQFFLLRIIKYTAVKIYFTRGLHDWATLLNQCVKKSLGRYENAVNNVAKL